MKIEDIELVKVQHLGNLGHSLTDIEGMSEDEINDLCMPQDEIDYPDQYEDERAEFNRDSLINKIFN